MDPKSGAAASYAKLPLSFVPNRGQLDRRVSYYAQGSSASFYFTKHKAVLAFTKEKKGVALELHFLDASPKARLRATDRAAGKVNYMVGNDSSRYRTGIPTYRKIVYRNLWPRIDLALRGTNGKLTYEFLLKPGADPSDIKLAYRGANGVRLDGSGSLLIETPLGPLRDAAPHSYQRVEGRRVSVESRYLLEPAGSAYGFRLGHYDPSRPLVIDPALAYSTYLGGSSRDLGLGIAVDGSGSAYVSGLTDSSDLPTTAGAFQTTYGGDPGDAFISKLSGDGSGLVYSTYLGGSNYDIANGIAVDANGSAYVTGDTDSLDFPTTLLAYDKTFNSLNAGEEDVFVAKLDPEGSALDYSTYLGGAGIDSNSTNGGGHAIAVDSSGSAYVTGQTTSLNFPTTLGAFDVTCPGGFVTKLNAAGSTLSYSTCFDGGVGEAIAVDSGGSAYVSGLADSIPTTTGAFDTSPNGGSDAFVMKLDPGGSALVYSTYLGGASYDESDAVAVDPAGDAFVSGLTDSSDFPTTPGSFGTSYNGGGQDAFVTEINATGSSAVYSGFLGGTDSDAALGVDVDAGGSAYVTGLTLSPDFPVTPGAFDTTNNGGNDAFVTRLSPGGSEALYSTFMGGTRFDAGFGITADASGSAYVVGTTESEDLPTTPTAFQTGFAGFDDAFVSKLDTSLGGADLAVTKSDSPDPVGVRDLLTYTVTVDNNGPMTASSVTMSDTLPKSVRVRRVRSPYGRCHTRARRLLTCSLGDLANGDSATVTITVLTTKSGTITNTASATAASPADPSPANNTASESTTVQPP